ncbi:MULTISPECIES: anti-sigma F factor antagonist [Geomicrobium]|uniref:Anti-sigma F factor antagonist n=1 Tax=Geomicrobium sediminis TaxID=1347788 RepID=A0ABS2PDU5_9BACL|nr:MULTISPECIES: anti-sigma F factor antagonist [Geomicrobium]MBM7633594.1 stage II sporulation protein AA (anti-sigma F factor antagonist) [Geomicrobium sediminis]GAK06589.1 anti-sigma F factor antagonist [Geomicrobium sp. JCM 19038]
MSFSVEVEQKQNILCVRLHGELDHHSASELRAIVDRHLEEHNTKHIVLNAEGLTFMDSSGIGVILGRYKKLQPRGGRLIVCGVSAPVYRLFEMAGLFKVLSLEEQESHALQALGEAV